MKYLFFLLVLMQIYSCSKDDQMIEEPRSSFAILLQFDEHGLTEKQIDSVITKVRQNFAPWDIDVITSELAFAGYAIRHKQRVFVTDSVWARSHFLINGQWYLMAGEAYGYGSMLKAPEYPAVVYTQLLGYQVQDIAGAITHELGHTIGLEHQRVEPSFMGKRFADPAAGWVDGFTEAGNRPQNDIAFITSKIGLKK